MRSPGPIAVSYLVMHARVGHNGRTHPFRVGLVRRKVLNGALLPVVLLGVISEFLVDSNFCIKMSLALKFKFMEYF